jgi:hypothetical protein
MKMPNIIEIASDGVFGWLVCLAAKAGVLRFRLMVNVFCFVAATRIGWRSAL